MIYIILGIIIVGMLLWIATSSRNTQKLKHENLTLSLNKVRMESDIRHSEDEINRLRTEITHITSKHEAELNQCKQDHALYLAQMEQKYMAQINSKREQEEAERIRKKEEDDARFKALAADILGNTQRDFREQQELRMAELLTPLRENIDQFKRSIEEKYTKEAQERFSLKEKIEELRALNTTIGQEARELTAALRGNSKTQGDWGEVILENILEKSGLQKDREFFIQETHDSNGKIMRDESGRGLRPDVIVKYPDGRYVVIDSKVSLTDFVIYANADSKEDRNTAGKAHVASVRRHIMELSAKSYQDYIGDGKTDFVMMFIPHESAYIAAMQLAPELWQEAYDRRVLIISPTHLISVLKLISQLWNHDSQTKNALEIALESGRMYDKFVAFTEDLQKIEKGINAAHEAYDKAVNKLKDGNGNLITRALKLKKMGAKASKNISSVLLPSIDDDPDKNDISSQRHS